MPDGGNLPPELAAQLDKIVSRMVTKCEPEMQEIVKLLHSHGIPGTSIELGMGAIPSPFGFPFGMPPVRIPVREEAPPSSNPPEDLVEGIHKILDLTYENQRLDIIGMVYDRNHNTAFEIAKIMDAARKRDRESLARELDAMAKKIRSK